jgi:hypothetical protein
LLCLRKVSHYNSLILSTEDAQAITLSFTLPKMHKTSNIPAITHSLYLRPSLCRRLAIICTYSLYFVLLFSFFPSIISTSSISLLCRSLSYIFSLLLFGSFNLHLVKNPLFSILFDVPLFFFYFICLYFNLFFFIMIYFSFVKDLIVFNKICQNFCFIGKKKEMERCKIKQSSKLIGNRINNFCLGLSPYNSFVVALNYSIITNLVQK